MKLFNDILKTPNGKYSRKSVYALLTVITAIVLAVLGLFRVGVDTTLVVEIVYAFLFAFLTLMGFTVWNKKIKNEN